MLLTNSTYHKRGELINGFQAEDHPFYELWQSMKQRCNNVNNPAYVNYGGRGITYCDEWNHFVNFARDMWPRPGTGKEYQIDRKDNDGNYCKDNCRWATPEQNSHNKRTPKNNRLGIEGVRLRSTGLYACSVIRGGIRYALGQFRTPDEASTYRDEFLDALENDPLKAKAMLIPKARHNSSSGIPGIQKDGNHYRVTKVIDGKRVVLGRTKDLITAIRIQNGEQSAETDNKTTGIKGISRLVHKGKRGNSVRYCVRVTNPGCGQILVGYFKTLEEAKTALVKYYNEQTATA